MLANTAERSEVNATPEIRGPIQLFGHFLHDLRKHRQCHEARLEPLLAHGILKLAALERLILSHPKVERDHVAGVLRADQNLPEELIRIERDRSQQTIELLRCRGRPGLWR